MSTYYYMACSDHKKQTGVIAVTRSHHPEGHLDSQKELMAFLLRHRDCCLLFKSEYHEECTGEVFEIEKFEEKP